MTPRPGMLSGSGSADAEKKPSSRSEKSKETLAGGAAVAGSVGDGLAVVLSGGGCLLSDGFLRSTRRAQQ
jgi:hypothetical protein